MLKKSLWLWSIKMDLRAAKKLQSKNGWQESLHVRLFRPEETLKTLTEYYFFNPSILPLIQKLANSSSAYPSWDILIESVQIRRSFLYL